MTPLNNNHIQHKISDFVLDLLPAGEKQQVARHIAGCADCRQTVQQERQIGRLITNTLNKATRPQPNHLQALMPSIPSRPLSLLSIFAPTRQWALACLLLFAMMGAFIFGGDGGYDSLVRQATNQPATVSFLNVPGTSPPQTTRPADTIFTISAEADNTSINEFTAVINNPPAAPQPVAPQVTPAPAATYFQ